MKHFSNLKHFAMLLLMAMACVSFTACGGDDDDDPIVNPDTPNDPSGGGSEDPSANWGKDLVGHWRESKMHEPYLHIIFNADGTARQYVIEDGYRVDDFTFSWRSISTTEIKVNGNGHFDGEQVQTWRYWISEDKNLLVLRYLNAKGEEEEEEILERVN